MWTLWGSVAVVISSTALGFMVGDSFHKRVRNLRTIQTGLQILLTQISYSSLALPFALDAVADSIESPVSGIFGDVGLSIRRGVPPREAWKTILHSKARACCLDSGDLAVLGSLGPALGASDANDQEKHLRLVLERLKLRERSASESCAQLARLWRFGGFACGVVTVLVLV